MSDPKPALKDMKEGLSSTRKPDITHVRTPFKVYTSRPCSYGSQKYQRGNYLRPVAPGGYTDTPTREDFERFRAYLRAADSHIGQVLDAMEMHLATDPDLRDVGGMMRASYAVDTDPDTTGKVGPSYLPHVAPACASLMMAISQAVACGLLPGDPGEPWADTKCVSPYAEEARESYRLHQRLDALVTPPIVDPLPGDGVGLGRAETDESLRARIKAKLASPAVASLDAEIAKDFKSPVDEGWTGRTRDEGVRR